MRHGFEVEQLWLRLSVWVNIVYVLLYVVVGIKNDSTAVVFDAICSLVYVISNILIVIYSRKIEDPATTKFQFVFHKC